MKGYVVRDYAVSLRTVCKQRPSRVAVMLIMWSGFTLRRRKGEFCVGIKLIGQVPRDHTTSY